MQKREIHIIGYASALGGPDFSAGEGPLVLQKSSYLSALNTENLHFTWRLMIHPEKSHENKVKVIEEDNILLANTVANFTANNEFFLVLGGDHTCAVGTWSGAYAAIQKQGDLGLIWIDAHMDSHTPQTTLTGNYHGMPLACLFGHGNPKFTQMLTDNPKLKPENVCLIGIRSFEKDEEDLLKKLKVKIYYMDEVKQRGLPIIMKEALEIATKNTAKYGISLDIDSIDPEDAPATDVSERGGIRAADLCAALPIIANHPKLMGIEITEFDPHRDIDQKTEKLIPQLILALTEIVEQRKCINC